MDSVDDKNAKPKHLTFTFPTSVNIPVGESEDGLDEIEGANALPAKK